MTQASIHSITEARLKRARYAPASEAKLIMARQMFLIGAQLALISEWLSLNDEELEGHVMETCMDAIMKSAGRIKRRGEEAA